MVQHQPYHQCQLPSTIVPCSLLAPSEPSKAAFQEPNLPFQSPEMTPPPRLSCGSHSCFLRGLLRPPPHLCPVSPRHPELPTVLSPVSLCNYSAQRTWPPSSFSGDAHFSFTPRESSSPGEKLPQLTTSSLRSFLLGSICSLPGAWYLVSAWASQQL